jgi:hypothetical protein
MAKLSANGTEVCRLERTVRSDERGTHYKLISVRSNGVALRAARTIFQGRTQTSRWRVHLTRKDARRINLSTPEQLRDFFIDHGFVLGDLPKGVNCVHFD